MSPWPQKEGGGIWSLDTVLTSLAGLSNPSYKAFKKKTAQQKYHCRSSPNNEWDKKYSLYLSEVVPHNKLLIIQT